MNGHAQAAEPMPSTSSKGKSTAASEDTRSTRLVFVSAKGRRRKAVGVPDGVSLDELLDIVRRKHGLEHVASLHHASSGARVLSPAELTDVEDLVAETHANHSPPPSTPPSGPTATSHSPSPRASTQSSASAAHHHSAGQDSKAKRGELPLTMRDEKRKKRSGTMSHVLRSRKRLMLGAVCSALSVFALAAYALHAKLSDSRA